MGRAVIAAALGQRDRAMILINEAFQRGAAAGWIHDSFPLDLPALRGYAPYERLLEQFADRAHTRVPL